MAGRTSSPHLATETGLMIEAGEWMINVFQSTPGNPLKLPWVLLAFASFLSFQALETSPRRRKPLPSMAHGAQLAAAGTYAPISSERCPNDIENCIFPEGRCPSTCGCGECSPVTRGDTHVVVETQRGHLAGSLPSQPPPESSGLGDENSYRSPIGHDLDL